MMTFSSDDWTFSSPLYSMSPSLRNRSGDRAHLRFLPDLGQHDQQPRQTLLARIEKMIDEVGLELPVAQQQERHEPLRHFRMLVHGVL